MTDEGFTLENIFIDGIGNQISNITLNSHNEMNALTKKKKKKDSIEKNYCRKKGKKKLKVIKYGLK